MPAERRRQRPRRNYTRCRESRHAEAGYWSGPGCGPKQPILHRTHPLPARCRAARRRAAPSGRWVKSHARRSANPKPLMTKRSEEHTSELQSLMRISYAVFCLKKKNTPKMIMHSYIVRSRIYKTKNKMLQTCMHID